MHSQLRLFAFFFGLVVLLSLPVAASATTTHYLRPDGDGGNKQWTVSGAASRWDALNDQITESETPSTADYISETRSGHETRLHLSSMNIRGVSVTKAQIWYYAANAQPFEVKSSTDPTWQISNSTGWHSISQTISSQEALNNLYIQIRTGGSQSGTPRQALAAFLKIETNGPKVYWGAWMDGDVYAPGQGDAPWNTSTWSSFESHAGKDVSIVHFGQPAPWQEPFQPGLLDLVRNGNDPLREDGALSLMDMGTGCRIDKVCEPGETVEEEEENRVSLAEINEGKYDIYYKEWAEDVAEYEYPFFFRWAWEMNGTWFKWGRDAAQNPTEYVEAWRRLHNIADNAGATNLTWVWCPNLQYLGSTPYGQLYPGDEYVDWTCLDGYNKSNTPFSSLFSGSYSAITGSVAPTKPLMVGETGTIHGSGHDKHSEWFRDALRSLPITFPKIKAFVWFNWNIIEEGKEWEWPIEWTAEGQKVFAEEIASPYFALGAFGSPPLMQPIQPLP